MGLDMYVYKASKPVELRTDIVYNYNTIRDKGYSLYEALDVEGEAWFADLMPFCVKIRCVAQYYDIPRIAEVYDLGENAHWSGFGPNGLYFIGSNKEVTIPDEEVEQYCVEHEREWYAVCIEEVAYWRKHYELQTEIHNLYKNKGVTIENCGYYLLDETALNIIKELSHTDNQLELYNANTLLYHEWY